MAREGVEGFGRCAGKVLGNWGMGGVGCDVGHMGMAGGEGLEVHH